MTLTFAALLASAARSLRRNVEPLLTVAATFLFLPGFAALLLCDPLPALPPAPRDEAAMQGWIAAVTNWAQGNGFWYVGADLVAIFGTAVLALLLLDTRRPTVAEALRHAARRLWAFLLVSMIIAIPVGLGLWLFVLPGLYVQARLIAAIPVLARRPDLGAGQALRVSLAMTRGHGWAITGALVTLFLAQWIVVVPLMSGDEWLRGPGHDNPLLLALVDAAITAVGAFYAVAVLLVGTVFYRLRASSGT